MQIPERLEYLKRHRQRGDLANISRLLSLSISTVRDIVDGKFIGPNGEKVLEKLEEMIEGRLLHAKALSKKYKKKIDKAL